MDKHVIEENIGNALRAHTDWKQKLKAAATSGALPKTAREIACDDQCSFGKWLHGLKADRQIATKPEFRKVLVAHAAFHREAGYIAAMVEKGDKAGAQTALDAAAFSGASEALSRTTVAWKQSL